MSTAADARTVRPDPRLPIERCEFCGAEVVWVKGISGGGWFTVDAAPILGWELGREDIEGPAGESTLGRRARPVTSHAFHLDHCGIAPEVADRPGLGDVDGGRRAD